MLSVRFLLVCEGTSDQELVFHLERCCILAGADEASGVAPDLSRLPIRVGHTVAEKLKVALELEPAVDFAFLHRDADSRNPQPRYEEIRGAIREIATGLRYVAVVPVQATEAWLLLNEPEIRKVAENPNGANLLDIPDSSAVENIADPKERFNELIVEASERGGRRRERVRKDLPKKKRQLLNRLDPRGPIREVPSWKRMFSDLESLIGQLESR